MERAVTRKLLGAAERCSCGTAEPWRVSNRRNAGLVDWCGFGCRRNAGDHRARTFADFDDYWTTILGGPSIGPKLAAMASEDLALLKARMRARLPTDVTGHITYSARANAVKGRVPK